MGPQLTDTDVLIVGAGPAGSAAATWAARAGLDVTLVDSESFTRRALTLAGKERRYMGLMRSAAC